MDSDHFPIQISLDKPLKRNTPLTELRYRFDKTDDDLLQNTLKDSLNPSARFNFFFWGGGSEDFAFATPP